jgi:hypothetical protein
VRRHVSGGPRIEGRSWAAPVTGEWFPARLVIADAAEALDAERGARRVVARGELICEAGADVLASDEIEVRSATLGDAMWRVVGAPAVLRTRTRSRAMSVPVARTTEAAIERITA